MEKCQACEDGYFSSHTKFLEHAMICPERGKALGKRPDKERKPGKKASC